MWKWLESQDSQAQVLRGSLQLYKERKEKMLEQAVALENRLIENQILEGKTFRIVKDGTGFSAAIPFGKEVDSEEWSYADDGSEICAQVKRKEFVGYLVPRKLGYGVGDSRRAYLPVPEKEMQEFIDEANMLLGE